MSKNRIRALVVLCEMIWLASPAFAQQESSDFSRLAFDAPAYFRDCPVCPEMTPLPDGSVHGKFPITLGEFSVFAAETELEAVGCVLRSDTRWKRDDSADFRNPGFGQKDNHPVVCISWLEATAYADWLSEKTGRFYRLPTLEESVAAAAGGTTTNYWWGEIFDPVCVMSNAADASFREAFPDDKRKILACNDGFTYTSPVGTYPPNAFGLFDVAGNVWEWTNSCVQGDCSNALFRGGAWTVPNGKHFRTSNSWGDRIVLRNSAIGFRVMRESE